MSVKERHFSDNLIFISIYLTTSLRNDRKKIVSHEIPYIISQLFKPLYIRFILIVLFIHSNSTGNVGSKRRGKFTFRRKHDFSSNRARPFSLFFFLPSILKGSERDA